MIVEELHNSPSPDRIARSLHGRSGFFYLDSARAEGNERPAFSFIGFDPFLTWSARDDTIVVESDGKREALTQNPLTHLRQMMARYRCARTAGIPFCGGAVGYFGYEFGAREQGVRASGRDEPAIPDAMFGFYDGVIAIEHSSGKTYAIAQPVAGRRETEILTKLREAVREASDGRMNADELDRALSPSIGEPVSNLTKDEYLRRVAQVKEYIAAGDVYQVNLAQRFELQTADEPFAIYERLRKFNPAPFGAYLDAGSFQILSSSPELLLRVDEHGRALTRPIKGTRPRGKTPAEDQRLAAELFASEKDHAELLMIVDLERNDLGRVCRYGSIQVEERHRIETHPTVFHLVATVVGQLRENADVFDCLRSMLPGGSITGAPKIRAMQLIDQLEPCRRHVYTGSLGYLGFDGTCDLNIAIRTILCGAGRASYHVGGGIVADSDPEAEYQETLAKGRAMRAALMGDKKT
ncbi:MAG: aminodeoxychorismate synthase component I [Lacunisphaera sp.]